MMSSNKTMETNRSMNSRRKFLSIGACGSMSNLTFLSTLLHLRLTDAVLAGPVVPPTGGYKALVCLMMGGGADSFNLLTPYGTSQSDSQYADYATVRGEAALKRSVEWDGAWFGFDYGYLHPIVDSAAMGGTGRTFGLHPRFQHLKDIYNAGHATFIANVGAMIDPIANRAEFDLTSKLKPLGLFSHADQLQHWQTATPDSRDQLRGWAGRMADLLTDPSAAFTESNVYAAISSNGYVQLLSGNRIVPYVISPSGAVVVNGIGANNPIDRVYTQVQAGLAGQTYTDLLEKSFRNVRVQSRDAAAVFQQAFGATALPTAGMPFPATSLGASFAAVARSIKIAQSASAPLRQNRQIFVVKTSSWDHHANVKPAMNQQVADVDNCLKAFYDFLIAENMLSKVTTFSVSEFGRTLGPNGSGTDHAWGGNPFVMGGAVNASPGNNRVWGSYPNIPTADTLPSGLDLGRGTIIPQISSDVYHAELCRWFGIGNDSNLEIVLPNIRRFYGAGQAVHPVGFLNY